MSDLREPTETDQIDGGSAGEPAVRTNWVVFTASAVGIIAIALWAIIRPEQAAEQLGVWVGWTSTWFGWFYIALATAILIFVIYLGASRYGHVRLGPDHSQPEFSTFSWAAMLFAAGIGTDLMFFSVAEPVTQYLQPPDQQGGTIEAAREATAWTLFHYGLSGWAMYALMGMALGYFAYRLRRPLAVRSALYPIFGKRMDGGLGDVVDTAAILGTVFGVATSLGIGVVQLNFGLKILFGAEESTGWQIALVVLAVVMAAISATTGVDRGIRFLSQLNVLLAIGLAAWVLVTGKTAFLLDAIVTNVGDFIRRFPAMTMETFAYGNTEAVEQYGALDSTTWLSYWTLFFWAWWIAWASFVGLFLARISRGRTIRQFVLGTMVIPFSYIVMWISIFGNSAIDRIRQGDESFGTSTVETPQFGFYTLLMDYPGATFIAGVATFVGLLFYVTSADSGALVMGNLSSKRRSATDDAAPWMRIVWAAVTGLLTIAVLIVGGVGALQNATLIMGLPFAIVLLLVMIGLFRALQVEGHRVDSSRHSLPQIISARGAQVDPGAGRSWKARLGRALNFVTVAQASRYLDEIVEPALRDVAAELREQGVSAEVRTDAPLTDITDDDCTGRNVELRLTGEQQHPFVYRVAVQEAPVPAYGGRMVRGQDRYARLEVHLAGGGLGYDVMGYSPLQIIHDCLDQYERHLEFLRLEDPSA
ncbi:choline BCCT transporter BetT [Janibacter sp. GXQ6167]|uniref:choline BCCT transporter BetT n=1 Tax=Janibacter sp. GXQ6167 TaxID=3240791 RepID=UPI0035258B91